MHRSIRVLAALTLWLAVVGLGAIGVIAAAQSAASPEEVILSAAFLLVLFNPIRGRIQRVVDRRFHGARYDGERTAGAFSVRMRDATDLPTVAGDLDDTVRRAIAPSRIGLLLRGGGR
jgi:hypothetical protein